MGLHTITLSTSTRKTRKKEEATKKRLENVDFSFTRYNVPLPKRCDVRTYVCLNRNKNLDSKANFLQAETTSASDVPPDEETEEAEEEHSEGVEEVEVDEPDAKEEVDDEPALEQQGIPQDVTENEGNLAAVEAARKEKTSGEISVKFFEH